MSEQVAVKVREATATEKMAIFCGVRVALAAEVGNTWEQIVEKLSADFHNPERRGDAEDQIKAKLAIAKKCFEAKSGAYKYHSEQNVSRLERLNNAMAKLGLGKRGRSAARLSAADESKINELLAKF